MLAAIFALQVSARLPVSIISLYVSEFFSYLFPQLLHCFVRPSLVNRFKSYFKSRQQFIKPRLHVSGLVSLITLGSAFTISQMILFFLWSTITIITLSYGEEYLFLPKGRNTIVTSTIFL